MSCHGLLDKTETLRLHVTPSLHSVEVHTARQVARVELHLMIAGGDVGVDELGDLLAEGVVDSQSDV